MKSTVYTMLIRDNVPELMPISDYGTLRMPDGKLYWIVPVEVVQHQPASVPPEPLPPPANDKEVVETIAALLRDGVESVEEITRLTNLSAYIVRQLIRGAGLQTPADKLRKRVEDALLNAGDEGITPHVLGGLCSPGQRLGPVISSMIKRGLVKKLNNGNYAIV